MRDVFIIGAGGLAKEVHFLLRVVKGYNIKAFVNKDRKNAIKVAGIETPVISEDDLEKYKGACLAFAIGDPKILNQLSHKLNEDFEFPNIIHPATEGDWGGINIGKGNIICPGVYFTTEITIGSFNIFNQCTIGHDTVIGNCNVFNPGCNISGGIDLESNILVGTNATILQYLKIGNNSVIGAASLVTKNVEPDSTVVGIPAKKMATK